MGQKNSRIQSSTPISVRKQPERMKCDKCHTIFFTSKNYHFGSCVQCDDVDFCHRCLPHVSGLQINLCNGKVHKPTHVIFEFQLNRNEQEQWNAYNQLRAKEKLNPRGITSNANTSRSSGEAFPLLRDDCVVTIDKPVFRIYAKKSLDFCAKVTSLRSHDKLDWVYPACNNGESSQEIGVWTGKTMENGSMNIGQREYRSVFWDAHTKFNEEELKSFDEDSVTVNRNDYEKFLEHMLYEQGMNVGEEMAEFLTYWVPQMRRFPACQIKFDRTFIDSRFSFEVKPSPDTIVRIYMIWRGLSEETPTSIPSMKNIIRPSRDVSIFALEWGGSQLD